jgi:Fur family transcriptional regulator, zinc uptake regulator
MDQTDLSPAADRTGQGHDHRRCIDTALAAAEAVCAERGVRLTDLRRRVLELVWRSHRPVGAYDLLEALAAERRRAAPPTVYRALDFLMEQGLVHRIHSLNAFVGCAAAGNTHAAQFLICSDCGDATEFDDEELGAALGRLGTERGFRVRSRVIELQGRCARCASGEGAGHA